MIWKYFSQYVYAGLSGSACWYATNLTSFVDAVSTIFYYFLLYRTFKVLLCRQIRWSCVEITPRNYWPTFIEKCIGFISFHFSGPVMIGVKMDIRDNTNATCFHSFLISLGEERTPNCIGNCRTLFEMPYLWCHYKIWGLDRYLSRT